MLFRTTTLQELLSCLVEDFICQSIYDSHFHLQLLFKVLMATYFDLMIVTLKSELLTLCDSNVKKSVSRQQKEKNSKKLARLSNMFFGVWRIFLLSWNWLILASILIVILTLMLFLMSSLYKSLGRGIPMGLRWRWMNI